MRDYLLPLATPDLQGCIQRRAEYSDAAGYSRALMLKLCVLGRPDEALLTPATAAFWADHSETGGLDGWHTAMKTEHSQRSFLGCWQQRAPPTPTSEWRLESSRTCRSKRLSRHPRCCLAARTPSAKSTSCTTCVASRLREARPTRLSTRSSTTSRAPTRRSTQERWPTSMSTPLPGLPRPPTGQAKATLRNLPRRRVTPRRAPSPRSATRRRRRRRKSRGRQQRRGEHSSNRPSGGIRRIDVESAPLG